MKGGKSLKGLERKRGREKRGGQTVRDKKQWDGNDREVSERKGCDE